MSQNVDLVRRAMEAAIRTPKPDFATVNELYDPEHEYVSRIEMLEGGSRRGARGYIEWRVDQEESAESHTRIEEATEIDAERVLVIAPTTFHFKHSGIALGEQRLACVVSVRDGRLVSTVVYASREDALEAIGIRE